MAGPLSYVRRLRLACRLSPAPEAVEPLLRHRIAEMGRDGDEFLTVALLDPRRHRLNRMGQSVGPDLVERPVLREPLEVTPGGEDEPCFAAPVAVEGFRRAYPASAGAFAFDDARLPVAFRAFGDEEQSVEAANGMELRDPPRKWRERVRVEFESTLLQEVSKRPIGD